MSATAVRIEVCCQLMLGSLRLNVGFDSENQTVAVVGPNGAGKTTLLRTLAGAYTPESGRIAVSGRVLFDSQEGINRRPEERRIGYVPQGYGLFEHLNVRDNVAFGLLTRSQRLDRSARRERARELLETLDGVHLLERSASSLSGGEKQKVALARALMIEPRLLLLDEPLGALDARARRSVRAYLAEHLSSVGTPTILVTHDVRDVLALDAHVIVVEDGEVVQVGSAHELASSPGTDFVAEFVGLVDT